MRRITLKKNLPACTLDLAFLRTLETFLTTQLSRLFAKELGRMRDLYGETEVASLRRERLVIDDGGVRREFEQVQELAASALPKQTRRVRLHMELGRPELMAVTLDFPRWGAPRVEVSTPREAVAPACQKMAEALQALTAQRSTRHAVLNNRIVRWTLVLLLPPAVGAWGWLQGVPLVALAAYQGWLVVCAGLLSALLNPVFPLVTFRTERRFNLRRLGSLVLFAATVSLTVGYVLLQQQLLWPQG